MTSNNPLSDQYKRRFNALEQYRDRVWQAILKYRLQSWIGAGKDVLDLGSGWGEFIRNVEARRKYAIDLNPDAAQRVGTQVQFIQHDCSQPWPLPDASLDLVFSSNFIEHLSTKSDLETCLQEAQRCLRPGGQLIFLGPNIRYVGGAYWDFWDHHLPLTERSLAEVLELQGFEVTQSIARFLPYTMSDGRKIPVFFVRLYLALPVFWRLLGKQFLVIAKKR
jgi:ubiquinone/menaquinone biosynthesis C-methylase UbiE